MARTTASFAAQFAGPRNTRANGAPIIAAAAPTFLNRANPQALAAAA